MIYLLSITVTLTSLEDTCINNNIFKGWKNTAKKNLSTYFDAIVCELYQRSMTPSNIPQCRSLLACLSNFNNSIEHNRGGTWLLFYKMLGTETETVVMLNPLSAKPKDFHSYDNLPDPDPRLNINITIRYIIIFFLGFTVAHSPTTHLINI